VRHGQVRNKTMELIRLSDLQVGKLASIKRVTGANETMERLRDLGLVPGEEVQVIKKAPFGDPIEIRIMNYSLCIRKSEARKIRVSL